MAEARAADQWVTILGLESTLAFNSPAHVQHSILWMNPSPETLEGRLYALHGGGMVLRVK